MSADVYTMPEDELERLCWAVKAAPNCLDDCPGRLPNGICTCGAHTHRLAAEAAFQRAIRPDVVLRLLRRS